MTKKQDNPKPENAVKPPAPPGPPDLYSGKVPPPADPPPFIHRTIKTIDWNQASELDLLYRINKEILHPLGLAVARDENGNSPFLQVACDGVFFYLPDDNAKPLSRDEIHSKLEEWEKESSTS